MFIASLTHSRKITLLTFVCQEITFFVHHYILTVPQVRFASKNVSSQNQKMNFKVSANPQNIQTRAESSSQPRMHVNYLRSKQ